MQQPAVYGVPVYTTDDSTAVTDTPTRIVHRKYSNNNNPFVDLANGMEEEEAYGTPTFFSKDESVAETVNHNPLHQENRPIMTILHEILQNKTASQGYNVKHVANITKSRSSTQYGYNPLDISGFFNKNNKNSLESTTSQNPIVYKHTEYSLIQTTSEALPTQHPPLVHHNPDDNAEYIENYDYHDKFKQIWPYRTDDKYSLFYFHPSNDDSSQVDNSEVYNWPSLSEPEPEYNDYHQRMAVDEENLNGETSSQRLVFAGNCSVLFSIYWIYLFYKQQLSL